MDPLAHTLVGAALAETGLKKKSAMATATLIAGVNLPDVDAVMTFAGSDTSLLLRRGFTHGVISLAVMPWLLAGLMYAFDAWLRKRNPDRPPIRFGVLVALSYVGVLSHPFLDWLNTYGVRVLHPFSGRWFYGDTLFIMDPWMWLLAGCAVVLAHSQVKGSIAGWSLLALAASGLVLFSGLVPWGAALVWFVSVALIVAQRVRTGPRSEVSTLARVALVTLAAYVAGMWSAGRLAERQAREWAVAQGLTVEETMANPLAANPFKRDVIIVLPDRYEFVLVGWLFGDTGVVPWLSAMPRLAEWDPVVKAALEAEGIRGFRNWMRYPSALVDSSDDGHLVRLYDVRYARREWDRGGIGYVEVSLDGRLQVTGTNP